jgi:hypothetical protein
MAKQLRKSRTRFVSSDTQSVHIDERDGRVELELPLKGDGNPQLLCVMNVATAEQIMSGLLRAIARARVREDRLHPR